LKSGLSTNCQCFLLPTFVDCISVSYYTDFSKNNSKNDCYLWSIWCKWISCVQFHRSSVFSIRFGAHHHFAFNSVTTSWILTVASKILENRIKNFTYTWGDKENIINLPFMILFSSTHVAKGENCNILHVHTHHLSKNIIINAFLNFDPCRCIILFVYFHQFLQIQWETSMKYDHCLCNHFFWFFVNIVHWNVDLLLHYFDFTKIF